MVPVVVTAGLPRALTTWAGPLAAFPKELALALAPMLPRLANAVGAMPAPPLAASGEPDGYDGIDRRGPLERLLVSEWLLLEELPDEFTRRAAAGELSFLRLAHRRPSASRRCAILFDAGPDQLGAPRLGQLALLIVLARRAEAAGAALEWGLLQDDATVARSGASPRDLHALLDGRTWREPDPARWDAWRHALALSSGDELWVVGAAAARALAAGARCTFVELADAAEPGRREIEATLRGTARRLSVRLPLPDDADSVRLLRDPFASRPRPLARLRADVEAVTFTVKSSRLMARASDGAVLVQTIPGSPREPPRPADRIELPVGCAVAAVGFAERRPVVASLEPAAVILHFRSRKGQIGSMLPFHATAAPAPPLPGAPPGALFKLRGAPLDVPWGLMVDGNGTLFALDVPGGSGGVATPLIRDVRAIAQTESQHVVVVYEQEGSFWLRSFRGEGPAEEPYGEAFPGGAAYFGFIGAPGAPHGSHDGLVLALQRGARAFDVRWGDGKSTTLVAPSGSTPAGVAALPWSRDVPGLLVVEDDRRTIALLGARRAQTLFRSSAPVVHATASPYSGHVACVNVAGELLVYGLRRGAVLLRIARDEVTP